MNPSPTYFLVNYGCQMNEHDAEIMEGLLRGRGWSPAVSESEADLVVLNTCTVREGAEQRALGRLQSLRNLKQRHPGAVVALCGCIAQEKGAELLERYDHLDLVIGTRDYVKLPDLVEQRRSGAERMTVIEDIDKPFSVHTIPARRSAIKALVNIMYGCNNRCAFCIVPKTRGREWSRPVEEIVAEVEALAARGYREVTLLGQNVNSYRDEKGRDFAELLRAVNTVAGLWRIRYTTSNPKDCRERHLRAVAEGDKICESLHLPVQSGSDAVLRRMRRSYNRERYLRQVGWYRSLMPESSITTDLIVGFCGETEEDFEQTLDLVERVRWDSAFMFMYSPRPGTYAAEKLADDVPLKVKHHRLSALIARQEAITAEINRALAGRRFEVLVEGVGRRGPGQLYGRTRTDKVVVVEGDATLLGRLCEVEIVEGHAHTLFGKFLRPLDAPLPPPRGTLLPETTTTPAGL
jgi:tRNA-2-methylthio-N6-dimethylallyladenosine synthase